MSKSKNVNNLKALKNRVSNPANTQTNIPKIVLEKDKTSTELPIKSAIEKSPTSNLADLELKIEEVTKQLESLKIQHQSEQNSSKDWQNKAFRYASDLDNIRKQHELDSAQTKKNTKKYVTKPLMEFLNNQYLAISFIKDIQDEKAQKSMATVSTGFEKLIIEFKLQNIEIIVPQIGVEFDANVMQSLTPPSDDQHTIKHIVSLGLKIDGQLIQPVMVVL